LGGTINLSVSTAAPLTYQWYRGLTPVSGATNQTFTISNATLAAVGSYYVAVTTLNGVVSSANVLVYTPAPPPPPRTFQQDSDGFLVIEAEHFTGSTRAPDGHAWVVQADRNGFSGTGYVQPLADSGVNLGSTPGFITNGARLDFTVNFTKTGTHYYWFRGGEPAAAGNGDRTRRHRRARPSEPGHSLPPYVHHHRMELGSQSYPGFHRSDRRAAHDQRLMRGRLLF
jgi:hypothetical protein